MWLLKIIRGDKTYQTMYDTLGDAIKYIKDTQNASKYELIYLEPNN